MKQISKPEVKKSANLVPVNPEVKKPPQSIELPKPVKVNRVGQKVTYRPAIEKNGVWVEVEFGNARVYYQDYIKFLLALRHRTARLGILLCPTNAFAQLLCDLGQRRASVKSDGNSKHRPSYSGMMSYEKAMRELPFLEFILTGSIVIAGIEIQGR